MDWDPEQLCERAQQQLEDSACRDPRQFPWGLYVRDDGPPFCGGGAAVFQWFPDRDSALSHLCDAAPLLHWAPESPQELDAFRQRLRAIAARQQREPEAALAAFNATLRHLCQLEWIGTYHELLAADTAFAQRLRGAFRSGLAMAAAQVATTPIQDSEQQRFVEFLAGCGS